ncbi:MAG: hypothetical protein R3A79_17470 [Nannocystaceae bacterium]
MLPLSLHEGAAPPLLGALAAVSERPEDPRVRRFAAFVAEELGEAAELAAELPSPPAAEALAAAVPEGARAAAVQRLVLAAMLAPPLTEARLERLETYAAALGRGPATEPALVDLRRALAGHHRRLSASLLRRFPPTERIKTAWRRGGFGDRWRLIKALLRIPDRATAERYRGLEALAEGTLGRAFFDHCRANGFPLPGERRGLPEPMTFHDMGHALVGAATDIAGETRMAGFEAGCMGERGFTMLEFTLLLFNLGARLPADAAPAVGAVDVDVLLDAFAVGHASALDVLAWDPWADAEVPLVELRQRYGIAV